VEESTRGFIRSAILTQLEGLKQTMETYRQPMSWSKTLKLWPSKYKACSVLLTKLRYKNADKLLLSSDATLLPGKTPMQSYMYAGLLKYCTIGEKLQSVQDLSDIYIHLGNG